MNKTILESSLPDIVILAGGEGKRMKSAYAKPLQPVFFRPMVHYVLDAAMAIPHRSICLVVGLAEQELREGCRDYAGLVIVRQETPSGTADAARAVESVLGGGDSTVLIMNADAVLMSARSLQAMLGKHAETGAACTVGRAALGRQSPAAFCFRIRDLFHALEKVVPRAGENESSIDDAVLALAALGAQTAEYLFFDPAETMDIDDHQGLWRVEAVLQERVNRELMLQGVSMQDPRTTIIDPRCTIAGGVRIEGGCTLVNSVLEAGVLVENFCRVIDSKVGSGSRLAQGTCVENSRVGRDCSMGPYARLRRGAEIADDVRIGHSVEIENSSIGSGTRAAHQSFIADAQVGRNVSIGCGFITCNSTGRPLKQRTVIGDNVFIGSASQAIAPVSVGAGSFIATGTSVTEDVPPDAFVISRGRQVIKAGYAKKYGKSKVTVVPH
jgi:bifunctional UDP-N-acetylglucosamine pyrophosphorylase/glucosamine-1-phosphate N-acetyltransferase